MPELEFSWADESFLRAMHKEAQKNGGGGCTVSVRSEEGKILSLRVDAEGVMFLSPAFPDPIFYIKEVIRLAYSKANVIP